MVKLKKTVVTRQSLGTTVGETPALKAAKKGENMLFSIIQ